MLERLRQWRNRAAWPSVRVCHVRPLRRRNPAASLIFRRHHFTVVTPCPHLWRRGNASRKMDPGPPLATPGTARGGACPRRGALIAPSRCGRSAPHRAKGVNNTGDLQSPRILFALPRSWLAAARSVRRQRAVSNRPSLRLPRLCWTSSWTRIKSRPRSDLSAPLADPGTTSDELRAPFWFDPAGLPREPPHA